MSKYYQRNEERLHKKLGKDIKAFLKKKKKKSNIVPLLQKSIGRIK